MDWFGYSSSVSPYILEQFEKAGVDAVVGSVGNGTTLRLISSIPGVKYTEGRFLPYFFPDEFRLLYDNMGGQTPRQVVGRIG